VYKLIIGSSDFKKVMENNGYYIDKTMLIKDVLEEGKEVVLLPRPRRFGKTLNMSMLYYFLNVEEKAKELFKGLKIEKEEDIMRQINSYPTIFLSLKSAKADTWEGCYGNLKTIISEMYQEKYELLKEILNKFEIIKYERIAMSEAAIEDYKYSLENMMKYLQRYYNKKVILLIDEYDVPLQSAWLSKEEGFYEKVTDFMQVFLTEALKDNVPLERGVLTGILRVAKESIFSGLNNIVVHSLLKPNKYNKYFGFTETEVEKMLKDFKQTENYEEVKEWYNGYKFGEETLYNPWSMINYVDTGRIEPYWINTSGNYIIKDLIAKLSYEYKNKLEALIQGEIIKNIKIDDHIVYPEIDSKENSLWSFMVMSGYLKINELVNSREDICNIDIPNMEVRQIYKQQIMDWFEVKIKQSDVVLGIIEGIKKGDIPKFTKNFKEAVYTTFSYIDADSVEGEKFYHGFSLGLAVNLNEDYYIKSNREVGYGRYDISVEPKDKTKHGYIIELKNSKDETKLEQDAEEALKQIEKNEYYAELKERGVNEIIRIAIAFKGKRCEIMYRTDVCYRDN